MNGVKSLAKPTLTYCQLGMCEQPSLKFVLKYNNLHLRKCMWKIRTSTILFLPQYVNILRYVTQPFVEFGAPPGAMKLVNNGSCDGLVPDGNSPLFYSALIRCVLIIIIIEYSFIYSFISILRDPTLIQCVFISIIIDYLLVSSWT